MASLPPHSEPSDAEPALSRAYPGFSNRLETRTTTISEVSGVPDQPPRRKRKRLSVFKRVERYVSAILKLGRTYGATKDATKLLGNHEARIDAASGDVTAFRNWQHQIEERLSDMEATIEKASAVSQDTLNDFGSELTDRFHENTDRISKEIEYLRTDIAETAGEFRRRFASSDTEQVSLSRAYSDLSRRLDLTRTGASAMPVPELETSGLDALTEAFYARLEDRYRGSREEIRKRLVQYLPEAQATTDRTGKPVLDLGCGRGEWMELLRGRGIEATGIDLNEMQLREARHLGLDVHLGDACQFLADAPDGSYGMVTAHHLVEHLPFKTLVWMTREVLRVLAPGGVLLYETPNARNVVVGASSFHVDPTHIKPLPAEVLTTLLDTVGFHPVESRFVHPHAKYDELVREDRLDSDIAGLLFGPQDLTVLGTKPGEVG